MYLLNCFVHWRTKIKKTFAEDSWTHGRMTRSWRSPDNGGPPANTWNVLFISRNLGGDFTLNNKLCFVIRTCVNPECDVSGAGPLITPLPSSAPQGPCRLLFGPPWYTPPLQSLLSSLSALLSSGGCGHVFFFSEIDFIFVPCPLPPPIGIVS